MADNVNEFDICWCRGNIVAGVTCPNSSKMKNKVLKLAEEHPDEVEVIAMNKDGSIFAHVPVKCITVRWPRKVSEEQAAVARQRFQEMWANRDQSCIEVNKWS